MISSNYFCYLKITVRQQRTQSWTMSNYTTVLGKAETVTNSFTVLHVFTFKALLEYLVTASSWKFLVKFNFTNIEQHDYCPILCPKRNALTISKKKKERKIHHKRTEKNVLKINCTVRHFIHLCSLKSVRISDL